jgi:uncharacterized protein YfaS (alpha-2-macroglobulin family)
MTIRREYLEPKSKKPIDAPKANQLVLVRLTIDTPAERHFVAIRDRLPAGLEPVNSRLATEAGSTAPSRDDGDGWEPPKWVHIDLRDDGAQVFSDFLAAGQHVPEYNARATIPGGFAALPAEVEAMYDPEIRAAPPAPPSKSAEMPVPDEHRPADFTGRGRRTERLSTRRVLFLF